MQPLVRVALAFCGTLALLSVRAAEPARVVFNVLDFGVVADGRTNNTAAFAKVMEACASAGGGTVWLPPGKYLTGSIALVDNLTLHLEAGAELLYSGAPADSPLAPARWEGTNVFAHAPLLYANGRQNIAITGRGTINGQGWNWWWRAASAKVAAPAGKDPAPARAAWQQLYARIEAGEKLNVADFAVAAAFLRPSLIGLYHCRNVLVADVTLFKAPMWMLHPVYSDDVVIRGVRFISADPEDQPSPEGVGPNGDGIDVDSCRNVRISDCFFTTSDDCIVIKSGRDNDGRRTNRPTEYITITNCVMFQGHGAVVIGSETAGGIRDITASNIVSKGTETGIRIKSQRGRGGVLENFRFDNWVIEDAQKAALEITMRYSQTPAESLSARTPLFRNFGYSNLTIVNARKVAAIEGLSERPIEQLRFTDINATGKTGFVVEDALGMELHHVRVASDKGSAFDFSTASAIILDDVEAKIRDDKAAAITLKDSADVTLRSSRAARDTATFLRVSGAKSTDVKLIGNDLSAVKTEIQLADGARPEAVTRP